jgi:hypothetical protein
MDNGECCIMHGFVVFLIYGNVKLFLGFINYVPHYEDVWGSVGIAPPFITSALDGGEPIYLLITSAVI